MKLIYVAFGLTLTVLLGLSFVVKAQTIEIAPAEDIYTIAETKYATSTIQAIDQIEQTERIEKRLGQIEFKLDVLNQYMADIYGKSLN